MRMYAEFRLRVARKALDGAKKSTNADVLPLEKEKAVWEEFLK